MAHENIGLSRLLAQYQDFLIWLSTCFRKPVLMRACDNYCPDVGPIISFERCSMAINRIQYQQGLSFRAFQSAYGTEEQ